MNDLYDARLRFMPRVCRQRQFRRQLTFPQMLDFDPQYFLAFRLVLRESPRRGA
jgi:hypothetical protein